MMIKVIEVYKHAMDAFEKDTYTFLLFSVPFFIFIV